MDQELKVSQEKQSIEEETGIVKNPDEDALYQTVDILISKSKTLYQAIDNNVLVSLPVLEFLIKKKDVDAQALFNFYCYCSKLQRNSRKVYAIDEFVRKNLSWRNQRLKQTKKRLVEYRIIRVVPHKVQSTKSKGMVFNRWFVEIVPLLNAQNISGKARTSVVPNSNTNDINSKNLSGSHSSALRFGNPDSIKVNSSQVDTISSSIISVQKFNKNKLPSEARVFSGKGKNLVLPGFETLEILQTSEPESKINLNDLIDKFKFVNPMYKKLFHVPAQRKSIECVVKEIGFDKTSKLLDILPEISLMKFAPIITTPVQFENKLASLMSFILKERSRTPNCVKIC